MPNEKRMISCCGDCINYSLSKHKCLLCKNKESDPQSPFYDDCPLPKGVEVVRCKDCVFYRDTKDWYGSTYKACHLRADVIIQKRNPDDFCSRGERRCE